MASPASSSGSCSPPSPTSPSAVDNVKQERRKLISPSSTFQENAEKMRISSPWHQLEYNLSDFDLVAHCLTLKARNSTSPYNDIIKDINPYKCDPDELPLGGEGIPSNEGYYFTIIKPSASEGTQTIRATPNGHWKHIPDSDKEILNHHVEKIIGFRRTLVFYPQNESNAKKSQWFMREYRLNSEFYQDEKYKGILRRIKGALMCRVRRGRDFDDQKIPIEKTKRIKRKKSSQQSKVNRTNQSKFFLRQF